MRPILPPVVIAAFLLAAVGASPVRADPLQDVITADLNAAASLATANGDTAGAACWTALAGERLNRIILPKGAGIFQLAEGARLTKASLAKPIVSNATASACGPVALDAAVSINQLVARVGLGFVPIPLPRF